MSANHELHPQGLWHHFSAICDIPHPDSQILAIMKRVYAELYGQEPGVQVVHAGLECGLLGSKYPEWDMISFGPTIRFPHSPDEKVHIQSVARFWDLLVATLKAVPEA